MDGKKALVLSTGIAVGLYFGLGFPGWFAGAFSILGFLGFGGWKPVRIAYKTLPRDFRLACWHYNKLLFILSTFQSITSTIKSNTDL